MCCYRDVKNFDRFNIIVQNIICLTICQLKLIEAPLQKHILGQVNIDQNFFLNCNISINYNIYKDFL